jgi:RimJ/RimL family protein N-acetyltransferase
MRIEELTQERNYGYKNFLHQGLTKQINSFRITAEDDRDLIFPTSGTEDNFTLGALSDQDQIMGVVSFAREGADREKLRHKGLLFRMYVAQEFSGQGMGGRLIQAVIDRAQQLPNMEQINLTVIASNAPARNLYQKFGFEVFSLERNAMKYKGKYLDEEMMALFLK